jgi:mRNA-degrading endonuclease RelE of RelBE toxin-antitoxin system
MSYSIRYNPQAEAALSSLSQEERSRIIASIRQLGVSGLSNAGVVRLNGVTDGGPTYALRADNDLRVVFTATHDIISVLDVLNRRFAQRYG